jgi:predicted transcriptional regulator
MPKHALLISVHPKFAEKIFAGTKVVELRRVRPRIGKGDLVFVYVSSPVMALEGAFEVGDIVAGTPNSIWRQFNGGSGLSKSEFDAYYKGKETAFAILIRKLWRLPVPVRLAKLRKERSGFHPPQSYHYICKQAFTRIAGIEDDLLKIDPIVCAHRASTLVRSCINAAICKRNSRNNSGVVP